MPEIRLDPFSGDYIIINDKRIERPIVSKETQECPFCPDSKKRHPGLLLSYDAITVENLFPALRLNPETQVSTHPILPTMKAIGKCEVVLYSSDHDLLFYDFPDSLTTKIIWLWISRYTELGANKNIDYVFIFENRGQSVGVTLLHPHGQLYATPVIPPKIQRELDHEEKHYSKNNSCLQCDLLKIELHDQIRIIAENPSFVAFVPYYSKWLYEVHIVPKRHFGRMDQITDKEATELGKILKTVRKKFDQLFNRPANYMMMLFPSPTDKKKYNYHHFRVEFVSVERDGEKDKYRAGVETGLHFWTNDISPERSAARFQDL